MKTYNYLLVDWDGCVARTLSLYLKAYKETFAEFRLNPSDKEIAQKAFGDWEGPKKLGVKDNDKFIKKLLKRVDVDYPKVELYQDSLTTLISLKERGKKMVLATSSSRLTIEPAVINTKTKKLFDAILAAEDVVKHKPDPEVIDKGLELLGGNKGEAIIIGDSKSDLGAAQNAGIDSTLFYPKENELFYDLDFLKSYNPTYIVTEFREILDIVK